MKHPIHYLIIGLFFVYLSSPVFAQTIQTSFYNFFDEEDQTPNRSKLITCKQFNQLSFDETMAKAICDSICFANGMNAGFKVISCDNVPNAAAAVSEAMEGDKRVIAYNDVFISQINNRVSKAIAYFIFAHELGHHINGHTLYDFNTLSREQKLKNELEADLFAGMMMARLKFTEAEACMAINEKVKSIFDGDSHPGKDKRLAKVKEGFQRGLQGGEPSVPSMRVRKTLFHDNFSGNYISRDENGVILNKEENGYLIIANEAWRNLEYSLDSEDQDFEITASYNLPNNGQVSSRRYDQNEAQFFIWDGDVNNRLPKGNFISYFPIQEYNTTLNQITNYMYVCVGTINDGAIHVVGKSVNYFTLKDPIQTIKITRKGNQTIVECDGSQIKVDNVNLYQNSDTKRRLCFYNARPFVDNRDDKDYYNTVDGMKINEITFVKWGNP